MAEITRQRIDINRHPQFGITTASKAKIGDAFQIQATPNYAIESDAIHVKLNPTGFLMNSTVVQNSLSSSMCLVANLESGNCYFIPGDSLIIQTNATLTATLHA